MTVIGILDYGTGNSKSVSNMLRKIGVDSFLVENADVLRKATKIVIPGVGSFDNAMKRLEQQGFIKALQHLVVGKKVPVLGICLGMQLLADNSEEGEIPGLGWIEGTVKKFKFNNSKLAGKKLKIPHMGWNIVQPSCLNDALFHKVSQPMRFYFVHSYHFVCRNPENILATCHYGHDFTCAVRKENIYGVQFHPEKSHKFGMQVLKNFVEQS